MRGRRQSWPWILVASLAASMGCGESDPGSSADAAGPDARNSLCAPPKEQRTALLATTIYSNGTYHAVYRFAPDGTSELVWTSANLGIVTGPATAYAWGDHDGDGDPDLAVGTSASGPLRVFRNDGDDFALVWESQDLEDVTGIVWTDYDGDGDQDLFEGTPGRNRLYRNDAGALTEVWETPTNMSSNEVAAGDYDGDGIIDLASGNNLAYPSKIFRGLGGDMFVESWAGAEGERSHDLDSGDYDGDGDLDLVTGNFEQPIRVYSNDGTGQLSEAWVSPVTTDPVREVAWADYDCDGDLDLAVATTNVPELGQENKLYEYRDGTYELVWSSPEADYSGALDWGDFDSDGDPDLAVGNLWQPDRIYRNDDGVLVLTDFENESRQTDAVAWAIW